MKGCLNLLSTSPFTQRAIDMTHAWFDHDPRGRQFSVVVTCLALAVFCGLLLLWFPARLRRHRRRIGAVQEQFLKQQRDAQQAAAAMQDQLYTASATARHHEAVAREVSAELATWKDDAQRVEQIKRELIALQERLGALSQDVEKEKEECRREHERNRVARDEVWAEAQSMRAKEIELLNQANDARAAQLAMDVRTAELAKQEQAVVNERARLNHLEMQLEDELAVLEKKDERITARDDALELRRKMIEEREAALPAMERMAAESSRRAAKEMQRLAEQRAELARARWELQKEQITLQEARRDVDSHRAALAAISELYDAKREQVELWHRVISRQ